MPDPTDLGEIVAIMLESMALSEESLRCTLTWAGDEYPCSAGPEIGGKLLDEGGFTPSMRVKPRVQIKVRVEVFPEGVGIPQEKQTILYKRSANSTPIKYRIDAITNFYDSALQLDCNLPSEGA